mmetsp:Transcript_47290/g.79166  ORF Transcript_47290/g.79166 Transcript_47290/m.79166 type:complete len:397 (-) Transcript_47290:843-2033(-)
MANSRSRRACSAASFSLSTIACPCRNTTSHFTIPSSRSCCFASRSCSSCVRSPMWATASVSSSCCFSSSNSTNSESVTCILSCEMFCVIPSSCAFSSMTLRSAVERRSWYLAISSSWAPFACRCSSRRAACCAFRDSCSFTAVSRATIALCCSCSRTDTPPMRASSCWSWALRWRMSSSAVCSSSRDRATASACDCKAFSRCLTSRSVCSRFFIRSRCTASRLWIWSSIPSSLSRTCASLESNAICISCSFLAAYSSICCCPLASASSFASNSLCSASNFSCCFWLSSSCCSRASALMTICPSLCANRSPSSRISTSCCRNLDSRRSSALTASLSFVSCTSNCTSRSSTAFCLSATARCRFSSALLPTNSVSRALKSCSHAARASSTSRYNVLLCS